MSTENSSPLADLPDAVLWSEGMLLAPQHLQQSDVYWHEIARGRMASLEPDYWGLLSLAVDSRAWTNGVLKIVQVSAVLPDGLPVNYPLDNEERQLTLDLKTALPQDGRPLRIWLGVPHRGGESAIQDGYLPRNLSCAGGMVADEVTGGNPVAVTRSRINLVLITEDKQLSRHSAFPLMEVFRNVDGHIQLGTYQPPMLRLGASGFWGETGLCRQLQTLSQKIWSKLRELAQNCDEDDESSMGQRYLEQARCLADVLPQYDVVTGSSDAHPCDAYVALSAMVGKAAALSSNPIPPLLFPYRHQECGEQFREAMAYVDRKLDGIDTMMEKLPFGNMGENAFARRLAVDSPKDELIIELKPRAGQEFKDMKQWLDKTRIASDDLMTVLRQRRLSGAQVRSLTHAERKMLGLKDTAILFLVKNQNIEVDGQQVDVFRPGRSLLIMGIADSKMPAGILLYRWKGNQPSLAQEGEIATEGEEDDPMVKQDE